MTNIDEAVELTVREVQTLQRRQSARAALVVVLLFAVAAFIVPNRHVVAFRWAFGTETASLDQVLAGTWAAGLLVGLLLASASTRHALGAVAVRSRRKRRR